jgi:hypothetical protein
LTDKLNIGEAPIVSPTAYKFGIFLTSGYNHSIYMFNTSYGSANYLKANEYASDPDLINRPAHLQVDPATGDLYAAVSPGYGLSPGVIKVERCDSPPCAASLFVNISQALQPVPPSKRSASSSKIQAVLIGGPRPATAAATGAATDAGAGAAYDPETGSATGSRVFVVAGFYTGVVDLQNLTVYEASKNHLEPIANLPTSFYAYASAGFTTTIDPTSNTIYFSTSQSGQSNCQIFALDIGTKEFKGVYNSGKDCKNVHFDMNSRQVLVAFQDGIYTLGGCTGAQGLCIRSQIFTSASLLTVRDTYPANLTRTIPSLTDGYSYQNLVSTAEDGKLYDIWAPNVNMYPLPYALLGFSFPRSSSSAMHP